MKSIDAHTVSDVSLTPSQRIQGRVDAIDGAQVFGWAWHADKPAERLTIEAVVDGKVIATAVADRARIDLRRNGIGDGCYAFNIELEAEAAGNAHALELRAVAASGEATTLRIPSNDERAAEAAVAVPLARVLERLDLLVAAQRQLHIGQRDTGLAMKTMTERLDGLCAEGGMLEKAVADVSQSQNDVAERVGSIEVFLARFDQTLAGFDGRLKALQQVGGNETRALVVMLAMMAGFVLGAVLILVAR